MGKNEVLHICYFVTFSCNRTLICWLIRTTSPPTHLEATLFSHPPSLSAFLIVTCHFLSLPLLPTAISDKKMNIRLSAEALREEGTVCREQRRKKKSNRLPFLNELQRAVTSEMRRCTLLTLSSRFLANSPAHICTHSDTHLGCSSRLSLSVLSLNGARLFFLTAESHLLPSF